MATSTKDKVKAEVGGFNEAMDEEEKRRKDIAKSEAISQAQILHVRKEDIQRYGEQNAHLLSKVRQAIAGQGLSLDDFTAKVNSKRRVITIKLIGEEGFNFQIPLPYDGKSAEPRKGKAIQVDLADGLVKTPADSGSKALGPDAAFNPADLPVAAPA